jgi:opacity protein-like surface antigen
MATRGDYMRRHLKLAFAAGVLLALGATGSASAADMAVKARPVVAPITATPWTGCYIGGNVGGGWTKINTDRVSSDVAGPAPRKLRQRKRQWIYRRRSDRLRLPNG